MASITMADLRAAVPPMDGEVKVSGLDHPVEILRDRWSIPHIRARGQHDAFVALGYVHAQDRLWQMEANLRRGVGRWAEWAGAGALEADKLVRRLDGAGAALRDWAALDGETRGMLEAYAAGVNAFIAGGVWPVEYRLLDATPAPWQPWHAIAVMRQRGFLMGSVWFKLWRAAALRTIGPDAIASLRHDDGGRDLLCIPAGAEAERWVASLADLAPSIEAVAALGAPDATGGGSNNWALAPSRTATGRPLLAGDPHRQHELPSMYAQTHIACEAWDVLGFTVPGVPGFPHFGHNGRVAWCVTHAFADIHDVYVDRFSDDGARWLFRGAWHDVVRRRETISVRGATDVVVDVTATAHGPVIAGDPASGAAVTLRSVQFDAADRSLACLLPMMRAASVEALYEASRGWGLIDHNLVAADTQGHIGHLVRAVVPVRDRVNGWLPVPGWTGNHEWQGMVPFERMPRTIDPPEGSIVTANNRFVADDHPDYLVTDCHPPYRARRIAARLAALGAQATLADMPAIHMDDLSLPGVELREAVRRLTSQGGGRVRDALLQWDGRMAPDSAGAVAYMAVRRKLARLVLARAGLAKAAADPLARVPPAAVPLNYIWWALPGLLRNNDTRLLAGLTWPGLLVQALEQTDAEPGTTASTWGELHRPRFVHPLSAAFPELAALLDPPGPIVGGDGDTVQANGTLCAGGLETAYGPIARYAYDVGNWQAGGWLVFHGASGHPGSPHYADQLALWARGDLVPATYEWDSVDREAVSRQRLCAS